MIAEYSRAVNIYYLIIKSNTFFGCITTRALYPRPEETGFYGSEG
jgi:hypothetical protein